MPAALRVVEASYERASMPDVDAHKAMIARIAADKDRAAFKALFLHFGPRIKALMQKAGASSDIADDLVQEVMMSLWRKAHLYSPEKGNVSTWIFTIARNARIDRLRRQSSKPYEDVEAIELASPEPDGEAEMYVSQRSERVASALAELPPEQKQIMELAFINDLPQSQIAEKLSLPLGTVKSRMRLAYGKLRPVLEDLA